MGTLKAVGIRELKNRLSEYLREVRTGSTILITDRGTVVAELREPELRRAPPGDQALLDSWAAQGVVQPPRTGKRRIEATGVTVAEGTVQSLLDLERAE